MKKMRRQLAIFVVLVLVNFFSLQGALASADQIAPVTQNPDGSYSIELTLPGSNVLVSFGLDAESGSVTDVTVTGATDTQTFPEQEGLKLQLGTDGQIVVLELELEREDDGVVVEAEYEVEEPEDEQEVEEDEIDEDSEDEEDSAESDIEEEESEGEEESKEIKQAPEDDEEEDSYIEEEENEFEDETEDEEVEVEGKKQQPTAEDL
jgi:hypothetical protein